MPLTSSVVMRGHLHTCHASMPFRKAPMYPLILTHSPTQSVSPSIHSHIHTCFRSKAALSALKTSFTACHLPIVAGPGKEEVGIESLAWPEKDIWSEIVP